MSSIGTNFGSAFIDFLGFIPTMTHFFNHEKLNERFTCLLKPNDFCEKYERDLNIEDPYGKAQMFFHYMGQPRTLTKRETVKSFWANLFGNDIIAHLRRVKSKDIFPYMPYVIEPNFGISVNPAVFGRGIESWGLSTEIRLFPQGMAIAHIKISMEFWKRIFVTEFNKLQNSLQKEKVFDLSLPGAKKLGLEVDKSHTMQELFEAISKRLQKTLYCNIENTHVIDKTPIQRHRIVIVDVRDFREYSPFAVKPSDEDVAAIMLLTENPRYKEIRDIREQRVEGLEKGDILAFYRDVTFFCSPETGLMITSEFRENYSNVIEFSLFQNFWLSMVNRHFRSERTKSTLGLLSDLGELDAYAIMAIYLTFLEHNKSLRGGHKMLYKLITTITNCESKGKELELSFEDIIPASQLTRQLEGMQKTLRIIRTSARKDRFQSLNYDLIDSILVKGNEIKSEISNAIKGLKDERDKGSPNINNIQTLRMMISKQIRVYRDTYLLQYQELVELLLRDKEQIEEIVDRKRLEGKQVPEKEKVDELLDSGVAEIDNAKISNEELALSDSTKTESFWKQAKPVVEFLGKAVNFVGKALGWWP
jgi:hypothetical protein